VDKLLNRLLDRASDLLGRRPGLLPLIAIALVVINFLLYLVAGPGAWLVDSDLFLHLGLILGLVGLLLIRVLE
jgi:hypothetical protein